MAPGSILSRRALLRLLGAGAAGAGAAAVLGGCTTSAASDTAGSGGTGSDTAGSGGTGSAATLAPAPDTTEATRRLASHNGVSVSGGVQHYRSRPDLRPPQVTIDVPPKGVAPGVILTDCHGGPAEQGPLILDSNGEVVFFKGLSSGGTAKLRAFNVRVQHYKNKPVLCWFEGAVVAGHGRGHYELYDTSYRQVATVHGQNGYLGDLHEFLLTDRGTALFTCYGQATGDLSHVGGSKRGAYFYGVVQEVDVATGKLVFQWRSDEHVPFTDSYRLPVPTNPKVPWDYFHVNSIEVDPNDSNSLIVSGRNTWAFYKIDRTTGAVSWRLGGRRSSFTMGPNTRFCFQHDVSLHADRTVTIFDNEAGPPNEASQSRGLVLALDEQRRHVSFLRQYHHSPPVLSGALGSVQDLPDGHRFIGWGQSTYFTEYDRNNKVILDGRLPPKTLSYRAFKQPWTGRPAEAPAAAARRSGSSTILSVSWNGATGVSHWRVLGGKSASQLAPVGVAARRAFETAIVVPGHPAFLAAEAVDASGSVLARSGAVKLA